MTNNEVAVSTFLKTKIEFITEFLAEIDREGYETMAQVRGALYVDLDKAETAKKAYEHERDAKLDNLTDEE